MNEPEHILVQGTRIVTHDHLGLGPGDTNPTQGMLIKAEYLDARKGNAPGRIRGWVPGHGGDVYWVEHDDGGRAAYGWWEFELATPPSSHGTEGKEP